MKNNVLKNGHAAVKLDEDARLAITRELNRRVYPGRRRKKDARTTAEIWGEFRHIMFIKVMSLVDELIERDFNDHRTAIPNGRAFAETCDAEFYAAQENGLPLSVALTDM